MDVMFCILQRGSEGKGGIMKRRIATGIGCLAIVGTILAGCSWVSPTALDSMGQDPLRNVEIVLTGELTDEILAELAGYGKVTGQYGKIRGLTMDLRESALAEVLALSYVDVVGERAERFALDYSDGISTWDHDIINITEFFASRVVDYDGEGVYVAVLDTGLVKNWRDYLPADQVAVEYAKAFSGGGGDNPNVSEPANKWERDTHSHGTHVTSTVVGYYLNLFGVPVNGAAPKATIIPVKVLNDNGSGWSSMIAAGIVYIADLKEELGAPMVINMSLGGPELSALEKAAIDYAIEKGVIVVASAGNEGAEGMGYPGAYAPVISVGSAGWTGEWASGGWWQGLAVAEPTTADVVYVSDFSSREMPGQDLDVLAPGSWIVGPYLAFGAAHPPIWSNGKPGEYYFLGGTSMAAPHVAGLAALMLQKDDSLEQLDVELLLEANTIPIPAGSAVVDGVLYEWEDDATGAGLIQADLVLGAF